MFQLRSCSDPEDRLAPKPVLARFVIFFKFGVKSYVCINMHMCTYDYTSVYFYTLP